MGNAARKFCEVSMAHVSEIRSAEVFRFPDIGGDKLLVLASGDVRTSGWSRIRLSPRYPAAPPADGLLELDFEGDPPSGPVLEVILPVTAHRVMAVPDWFKGVKAYAAGGSIT